MDHAEREDLMKRAVTSAISNGNDGAGIGALALAVAALADAIRDAARRARAPVKTP